MADLRLVELVVLRASFETRPGADWITQGGIAGSPYPDEELLQLKAHAERRVDEFVLRLDASLSDDRFPFQLDLSLGARFVVVDAPELTAERAESTLVFMTFPYLREVVWSFTGRSPFPAYALPPLTRLPDAPVRGDAPEIIKRPPPEQPLEEPSGDEGEIVSAERSAHTEQGEGEPHEDERPEPA